MQIENTELNITSKMLTQNELAFFRYTKEPLGKPINWQHQWLKKVAGIKNEILMSEYFLTIHIVSIKEIIKLNHEWRKKDEPTDILSFPYSDNEGEIFISTEIAKLRHKKYGQSYENFILFLLIHSMYHLLGYEHGPEMDNLEALARNKHNVQV